MLQQLYEVAEGSEGHKGGAVTEDGEGTRGLAKGSRATWVGKWEGRGSRIPGELCAQPTCGLQA